MGKRWHQLPRCSPGNRLWLQRHVNCVGLAHTARLRPCRTCVSERRRNPKSHNAARLLREDCRSLPLVGMTRGGRSLTYNFANGCTENLSIRLADFQVSSRSPLVIPTNGRDLQCSPACKNLVEGSALKFARS